MDASEALEAWHEGTALAAAMLKTDAMGRALLLGAATGRNLKRGRAYAVEVRKQAISLYRDALALRTGTD